MRIVKTYRGVSKRIVIHYLRGLGGDQIDDNNVEGDDWRVILSTGKVSVGPTLELNEVTVEFRGEDETLPGLVASFDQKARRAGG